MPTKISRYCDGIMEAAWLVAVILVPLFFNIYSSRIFEPDKITLLRSIALVILAAWLVKLIDQGGLRWENFQQGDSAIQSILRIPLAIPVIALAVIYLISTIFSVVPGTSFWGSYQRLQGTYTTFSYLIIFFALVTNLRKRAQVDRLITTIIVTSLPISLYGILQRYKLDPIPWGADTSLRIAGNMGNSIFVAAYLIMVFPLTLFRILDSFKAILKDSGNILAQVARATIYVFIAALQLIAIYMSGSRGPALGWMASCVFMFVLLSIHWRKRWVVATSMVVAVALGIFLIIFNLPNSPLAGLRSSPAIGRFGLLLNAESNSALVRRYIWEGVVKLVSPHAPIQYPDGSTDKWNFLRPLIGYGPESMYVAYNPFYQPDLGHVEKRNASPDRSHNETWDSIVTTGGLGLIIYITLFVSIFYFGLKWIGLIPGPRQRNIFLALALGGGVVGAVGVMIWRGVEYFGVGLPFGIVGGMILYIFGMALIAPYQEDRSAGEQARVLLMIPLLAAIVGHFIEINFGIAIAATRTYFYTYSALLLIIGFIFVKTREYETAASPAMGKAYSSSSKEGRRSDQRAQNRARRRREEASHNIFGFHSWMQRALIGSGIASIFLVTLGYDYITNPNHFTSGFDVLSSSFTRLGSRNSYGILALIFITWLAFGILWTAENTRENGSRDGESHGAPTLWLVLGISGLVGLIFWIWDAGLLAFLTSVQAQTIDDMIIQAGRVSSILSNFYFYIFLILFVFGLFFVTDWPVKLSSALTVSPVVGLVSLVVVIILINVTNLRIIHADIVFKMAEPYNRSTQWPVATILYKRANQLAPSEDYYYLFLGRSYLEQAKETTDKTQQDALVKQSESDLKVAQRINPLNTDHTANLARLYSWWASIAPDNALRTQRAQISSNYYATALKLSPQNSQLWGEWAVLFSDVLHDYNSAYQRLQHALDLDPEFSFTQGLMGDYYFNVSRTMTDTNVRKADDLKAIDHYTTALNVRNTYEVVDRVQYLVKLGNVYTDMGDLDQGISYYLQAAKSGADANTLWRIQETVARLYAQKGDKTDALSYAQQALASAPKDQSTRLQTLITQIQGLP